MIIVNGQQMSEEEFARLQEEVEQKKIDLWNRYRQFFNCNNAIVVPAGHVYGVVCSLDRTLISKGELNKSICEGCKAFNDTDYTKL